MKKASNHAAIVSEHLSRRYIAQFSEQPWNVTEIPGTVFSTVGPAAVVVGDVVGTATGATEGGDAVGAVETEGATVGSFVMFNTVGLGVDVNGIAEGAFDGASESMTGAAVTGFTEGLIDGALETDGAAVMGTGICVVGVREGMTVGATTGASVVATGGSVGARDVGRAVGTAVAGTGSNVELGVGSGEVVLLS